MTDDSITQRVVRSIVDKITSEMIEATEAGKDYNPKMSIAAHTLAMVSVFSGINQKELFEIIEKQGKKNVALYGIEKTARVFYGMPLPPVPGAIAVAQANRFKGLETVVFAKQENQFSIKRAYFDEVSLIERDNSPTTLSMRPPRIEQVYSGRWDGNYKSLAERVEPYIDSQTCLFSSASAGTPDFVHTVCITGTISELFAKEQQKSRENKND